MISANAVQQFCTLIWFGLVVATLVRCCFSVKQALRSLLVCVLLSPVLQVGGQTVRIELVLVPLLLFVTAIQFPGKLFGAVTRPVSLWLLGWLLWVMVASLWNGGGRPAAIFGWWIEVYGLGRLLMVFWLFSMFSWTSEEWRTLMKTLALTAVPIGLLSIGQVLNVAGARLLTAAAYVPATSPVFQQQLEKEQDGYVFRALGVFGNVSPAAFYFSIVAGSCLVGLLPKERGVGAPGKGVWLTCGLVCALGGIATMSGTFVAGFPIIIVLAFWVSRKQLTYRRLFLLFAVLVSIVVVTLGVVYSNPRLKAQYDYQVEGLISGERFKSRYDDEVGVTRDAAVLIAQHPLLGGFGREQDVFIGDSVFTLLGFYGGYIGAGLFAIFLVVLFVQIPSRGVSAHAALWLLGAGLFGISTTSVFTLRLSDWWWAIMGIASAAQAGAAPPPPVPDPGLTPTAEHS